MRGEVHILVHCPIDTLQWGSTHSAMVVTEITLSSVGLGRTQFCPHPVTDVGGYNEWARAVGCMTCTHCSDIKTNKQTTMR